MKRIFERIVVSDAPPTPDALWIDTSSETPKMKMSFDGQRWIEIGNSNQE